MNEHDTETRDTPQGQGHTPGPWRKVHDHPCPDTAPSVGYIRPAEEYTGYQFDIATVYGCNGAWGGDMTPDANACRIVACVNACEGIPTEALDDGAVADMLEALRPFAACADELDAEKEWDDEEWAKFRLLVKHYRAARSIIAKAEGKA